MARFEILKSTKNCGPWLWRYER